MSVAALRRDGGADFESRVAVSAGGAKKNFLRVCLPWFFDQRDFVTFSEVSDTNELLLISRWNRVPYLAGTSTVVADSSCLICILHFLQISRFIVVKRNCCFVYLEPTDGEPLYAFSLSELNAEIEDPNKPDKYSYTVDPSTNTNKTSNKLTTVILRNKFINKGNLAYQLTFDTSKEKGVVKKFMEVMERAGSPIVASLVDNGKSKKSRN